MSQDDRIKDFMKRLSEVTVETGITYAVEHGQNIVLFDVISNEPIELEITIGTEVINNNGRSSLTVFDRSNVKGGNGS